MKLACDARCDSKAFSEKEAVTQARAQWLDQELARAKQEIATLTSLVTDQVHQITVMRQDRSDQDLTTQLQTNQVESISRLSAECEELKSLSKIKDVELKGARDHIQGLQDALQQVTRLAPLPCIVILPLGFYLSLMSRCDPSSVPAKGITDGRPNAKHDRR